MPVDTLPDGGTLTANSLTAKNISGIAAVIRKDWGAKVNFAAKPYLDAMETLNNITDNYIADTGTSIVAYFLSNATGWRGETAKLVKAELKRRLKQHGF